MTYAEITTAGKIESPMLTTQTCSPRCCFHFGIGRRVCCRCGTTRVEKPQALNGGTNSNYGTP